VYTSDLALCTQGIFYSKKYPVYTGYFLFQKIPVHSYLSCTFKTRSFVFINKSKCKYILPFCIILYIPYPFCFVFLCFCFVLFFTSFLLFCFHYSIFPLFHIAFCLSLILSSTSLVLSVSFLFL